MNNIVKLVSNMEKPNYTKRLRNADDAMETLRMEIYAWDHKELAKAIGVSPSCIMPYRS